MSAERPLSGKRVLIVEDEALVAMLLEDMLAEIGCEVVGSVSRIEEGVASAGTVAADLAVLDVNVAGQPVFPVAEALSARGIPFVFATGYGPAGLPDEWKGRPTVQKPFSLAEVERCLSSALRAGAAD